MQERRKLPLSMIVATRDRATVLNRLLGSIGEQSCVPEEIIVVDGSAGTETEEICLSSALGRSVRWFKAAELGAATQRGQGLENSSQAVVGFIDDDVILDIDCLSRLWSALSSDSKLGGANATITNQRYTTPGAISRTMFALLNGRNEKTFAGRVIGPAVNLLPEDRDDLPEVVPVEWMNLGCTLYRREALPDPVFDPHFSGYSLMEDLTLSLRVAQRGWKLANVRTARVYHDSQPGSHKSNLRNLAAMELRNRHYVMSQVLRRTASMDYARLAAWEMFAVASILRSAGPATAWNHLLGKWDAICEPYGRVGPPRT